MLLEIGKISTKIPIKKWYTFYNEKKLGVVVWIKILKNIL